MPTSRTERLQALYLQMCRIRCTEEALARLWRQGLISGELHLGIGEEGIVAGVLAHLANEVRLPVAPVRRVRRCCKCSPESRRPPKGE